MRLTTTATTELASLAVTGMAVWGALNFLGGGATRRAWNWWREKTKMFAWASPKRVEAMSRVVGEGKMPSGGPEKNQDPQQERPVTKPSRWSSMIHRQRRRGPDPEIGG